jgi:hypothetical protein
VCIFFVSFVRNILKKKLRTKTRRTQRKEFYFFVFSAFFAPPRETKKYISRRDAENAKEVNLICVHILCVFVRNILKKNCAQRHEEHKGKNYIFSYSLRSLRLRAKQKIYFAQRRGERKGSEFYLCVYSLCSLCATFLKKVAHEGTKNAKERILFFRILCVLCASARNKKIYFAQRRGERKGREFYLCVYSLCLCAQHS